MHSCDTDYNHFAMTKKKPVMMGDNTNSMKASSFIYFILLINGMNGHEGQL